jgi:polysaccharide export outer membrane protein
MQNMQPLLNLRREKGYVVSKSESAFVAERSGNDYAQALGSLPRSAPRRPVKANRLSVFFLVMALVFSGCQSPAPNPIPPEWKAQTPGALAAGDVLKLTFPGAPELNQAQKIRADGKVSLPLIGETYAAGKQLGELQRELSRLYEPQLKNSEVLVTLESSSTAVYVGGAVAKPGKVVLDRPMTALEAIMEVGGFTPDLANPKKVSIIRTVKGQQTTQIIDLSPGLRGESSEAFYLRAFDVVYVPQSGFHF